MERFDEMAATWDEDPIRQARARKLADDLRPIIQEHQLRRGLDFGSGTGMVSFFLLEELEQIDLVDVSVGMIEQAQRRIQQLQADKVRAFTADLTRESWDRQYDCIYTLLTLHHIQDVNGMLKRFHRLLLPGGYLCIADLEEEDGSFHDQYSDFDGHNGFDPNQLADWLRRAGFGQVRYRYFYSLYKDFPDGEKREYPMFLLIAKKE